MRFQRPVFLGLPILAALSFMGCESNRYEIVMKPRGETIERDLTCSRGSSSNEQENVSSFPIAELQRIAAEYEAAIPDDPAQKHKFAGEFGSKLPNDIGGSGSYTYWQTPLGSVSAYVERFRGDDDLAASVNRRQQATDRITDLVTGWLETEMQGDPGFEDLREFLQVSFRQDLKNLSLYAWAYEIVSKHSETTDYDGLVRVGQYLVERDYFTAEQLPTIVRALQENENSSSERLLQWTQRFLAKKMGVGPDESIPESLKFLSDAARVRLSFDNYLSGTEEAQLLIEQWEQERANDPDLAQPEPQTVLGDLLAEAFLPNFQLAGTDELTVKIEVTSEPFLTNGQWLDTERRVEWSRNMLERNADLSEFPTLMYALWAEPNEMVQQAYFGQVVLEGEALGNYGLWYRGLSDSEAREWDKFLATVPAGKKARQRLTDFRFSSEASESECDVAATGRELILSALGHGDEAQ